MIYKWGGESQPGGLSPASVGATPTKTRNRRPGQPLPASTNFASTGKGTGASSFAQPGTAFAETLGTFALRSTGATMTGGR